MDRDLDKNSNAGCGAGGNSNLRIRAVFVLMQGLKSDKERVCRKAAENF